MRPVAGLLALVPAAAVSLGFLAAAWREQGSVVAADWLPYALGVGLLAATVLASGAAVRPRRFLLVGMGALALLALWTALSAAWSPMPASARDEALLLAFYAFAVAVPVLTLRSEGERLAAIVVVVAAAVLLVIATSARLLTTDTVSDLYISGRLAFPIRYPGAQAAILLLAFWPAAAVAASRRAPVLLRALALGGCAALLAGWLITQSRAAGVALAISAVIVFAFAPARLRLFLPAALAAALVGAAYGPLTEPFRRDEAMVEEAIRGAGRWTLVLSVGAAGVGLLYALADRRLALPARLAHAAGLVAIVAIASGALAGIGGFLVAVDAPDDYLRDRWEEFKHQPETETGSSHLVTIGSNRYDFWRVALNEFREHPVAGAGARSFGTAYLRDGRTSETPQRAHSFELDVVSETGLVGLVLLATALLPFLSTVLRRARRDLVSAGVLGGVSYWIVHASADWTWTFPAAGVPFFLLLGAGVAGDAGRTLTSRAMLPAALVLAAAVLVVFVPPWLSSRFTSRALEQGAAQAADDLRWARRLDPLSIEPHVAEAALARSPNGAISPLEDAVQLQPRSVGPRYLLGLAYLEAGRRADAQRELRQALRLAPRSDAIRRALRRAEPARTGG